MTTSEKLWKEALEAADLLECWVPAKNRWETSKEDAARALLRAKAEAMREARMMKPFDQNFSDSPWYGMELRAAEYERAAEKNMAVLDHAEPPTGG